jgi:hypothetical protein
VGDQHLISADELRAAGALDVPAAWRKSLQVDRDPAPSLFPDEDDGLGARDEGRGAEETENQVASGPSD